MRFKALMAMATSVVRRRSVCERSASPITSQKFGWPPSEMSLVTQGGRTVSRVGGMVPRGPYDSSSGDLGIPAEGDAVLYESRCASGRVAMFVRQRCNMRLQRGCRGTHRGPIDRTNHPHN
jgi:hypothetical protein